MNIGIVNGYCPPHSHNCHEIIIFTKGTGTLHANNQRIEFSPGLTVILPPTTMHETVSSDFEFERIYINEISSWTLNLDSPIVVKDNDDGENLFFAQMIYRNRFRSDEYISSLTNNFIQHILLDINVESELNSIIKSIINKITTNFSDAEINISYILNQSGYAEDYIRAQFKRVTGKTPIRFLTECRIAHACFLMDIYKGSLSLTEIAEKCGYTDYVYFSRRFKEIKGIPPRKYMRAD